ncbi:hypothetical protein B0H17DRAFT_1255652 [Mycena rosella]|uniref:Uncharacterized protein n=1 Tax=Mycena rosella TaxID=1033263 RepID=A0AAD7DVV2_MYCRO|nr:hypothetical protein B0H17DRAFT_1255652 [Mycena rosella]
MSRYRPAALKLAAVAKALFFARALLEPMALMTRHELSEAALLALDCAFRGRGVGRGSKMPIAASLHCKRIRNKRRLAAKLVHKATIAPAPSHLASKQHRAERHPLGHLRQHPRMRALKIELHHGSVECYSTAAEVESRRVLQVAFSASGTGVQGAPEAEIRETGQMAKHRGPAAPRSKRRSLRLQKYRISDIMVSRPMSRQCLPTRIDQKRGESRESQSRNIPI